MTAARYGQKEDYFPSDKVQKVVHLVTLIVKIITSCSGPRSVLVYIQYSRTEFVFNTRTPPERKIDQRSGYFVL